MYTTRTIQSIIMDAICDCESFFLAILYNCFSLYKDKPLDKING